MAPAPAALVVSAAAEPQSPRNGTALLTTQRVPLAPFFFGTAYNKFHVRRGFFRRAQPGLGTDPSCHAGPRSAPLGAPAPLCLSSTTLAFHRYTPHTLTTLADAAAWRCVAVVVLAVSALWAHADPVAQHPGAPQTVAWSAPALTADEQAWLREHPVVRVGVDPGYAPYSSLDDNQQFQGVAADFLAIIGAQLGIRFEVSQLRRWTDILQAAQRRDIDLVATVVPVPGRERYLAFTDIYLQTPLVITARQDDHSLHANADLNGRPVALVQGYSSSAQVVAKYPGVKKVPVANPLEGLVAVATGRADAYVGAMGVNLALTRQYGLSNLRIAAAHDIGNGQRFGVRSDWAVLATILDKALAAIPPAEKDRIHLRWVPQPPPRQVNGKPSFTPDEHQWMATHSRIRLGLRTFDEPVEFFQHGDDPAGLVAGYVALLKAKSGLEIDVVPLASPEQALDMLVAGDLDMVSTRQSPLHLPKGIRYSDPFESSALAVFMRQAATPLNDLSALAGRRLAMPHDSSLPLTLGRLADLRTVAVPSAAAALTAVQNHDADAAVLPAGIAHYLIAQHAMKQVELAHVLPAETSGLRFVTASDTLASIVNRALGAATTEDIADIRRQALALPPVRGIPVQDIAYGSAAAALLVLMAVLIMRRSATLRLRAETAQRERADEAARQSEARFAVTFEQAAVGMAHVAPDGSWLKVNHRLCDMLGYSEAELLGTTFQQLTHPDDLDADVQLVNQMLAGGLPSYALEKRYLRKNGDTLWGLLTVSLVRDANDQPDYFISVVEDISQRKADEARIAFLAYHDVLTSLPNRALMADRAATALAGAQRSGHQVALLYLDLDHFKEVNDSLGHTTGDQLLMAVTERLTSGLRASDSLGRHGGDEFLVLVPELPPCEAEHAATATADKLLELLRQPFYLEGNEMSVNTSIGIALSPADGNDFETLLRKADTALYAAKSAGRGMYRFFSEAMNLATADDEQLRNGIRFALERGQLSVHYQPQFDLVTRQMVGAEALLRWNHPVLGAVPPGRFIPIAEDSGVLIPIGAWVMEEACRQAKAWQALVGAEFTMAVNLSATQFRRGHLVDTVRRALQTSGLNAHHLELELTESILIQDTEAVLRTMQTLKALGVQLSIDDFGTGYSSLSYLQRFSVQKLKIDQSFVRDMVDNADAAAIVQSIIGLATTLRMTIIAEGVETPEQLALLGKMGCQQIQGYLLGKPMPAEAFTAVLRQAGAA